MTRRKYDYFSLKFDSFKYRNGDLGSQLGYNMYYIPNDLVSNFDLTIRKSIHFNQVSKYMYGINRNEEKPCLRGFQNLTVQPHKVDRGLKFGIRNKRDLTIYVAKAKALFSCVVSRQLICNFVFAYAKSRFCHDVAHVYVCHLRTHLRLHCRGASEKKNTEVTSTYIYECGDFKYTNLTFTVIKLRHK